MAKPQYTDFRPKWAIPGAPDYRALADTPNTGTEPDTPPRLPIRIIPADEGSRLTAATLADVIATTQRIVSFAGHEAIFGINPDFADLRTVDTRALRLAKLSVEPFEEGSFIIPAELVEEDVELDTQGQTKRFSARDVLYRFVELMESLAQREPQKLLASIGAIQAVEELGKVLNREAKAVEYRPALTGRVDATSTMIAVDAPFVKRVSAVRRFRQEPYQVPDTIEGMLTAIDLGRGTLKIRLQNESSVSGTFWPPIREPLVRLLGRLVRLSGVVEYRRQRPIHIQTVNVEQVED